MRKWQATETHVNLSAPCAVSHAP